MKIVCVLFISCAFTIRDAILHPDFALKPLAPFVRWFGAAQPSTLLTIITLCLSPIPSNQNDLLHIAHSPTNNFSNYGDARDTKTFLSPLLSASGARGFLLAL